MLKHGPPPTPKKKKKQKKKKEKQTNKLKISEFSTLSLQGMLENILIPYITVLSIYWRI
jgi:hypothetical protein